MTTPEVAPGLQPLRGVYKNELMTTTTTRTTAPLSVAEIVHVDCRRDPITTKNIVLWEDILLAFEDAVHVRHNSRVLSFLRGPNFQVLEPFRIEAMPDVVLNVVLRDPLNQQDTRGISSSSSTTSSSIRLRDTPEVVAAAPTASMTSTRTTPAPLAVPSTAPTVEPVVTTTPGVTSTQFQNSLRTALSFLDDDQDDEDDDEYDDAPPPNYQQAIASDPIYYTTTGNRTAAAPLRFFGHRLRSSMASVPSRSLPIRPSLDPLVPRTSISRGNTTATTNSNNNTAFHAATRVAATRVVVAASRITFDPTSTINTTITTFPPLLSNSTRVGLRAFTVNDSRREDDNDDSDDDYDYDDTLNSIAAAAVVDPTQRPSVVMHQLQNRVVTNNNNNNNNNNNIIGGINNNINRSRPRLPWAEHGWNRTTAATNVINSSNNSNTAGTGGQRVTTATAAGTAVEAMPMLFRPPTGIRNSTANTTTTPTTGSNNRNGNNTANNNQKNSNVRSPVSVGTFSPNTSIPWIPSFSATTTARANIASADSGGRQPILEQQQPQFMIVNGILTRATPSIGNATTTTATAATNAAYRPTLQRASPFGVVPAPPSPFTPLTTTTATTANSVYRPPAYNNSTPRAGMTFSVVPVPAPPLSTTSSSATNTNHPFTAPVPAVATPHKINIEMLIASAKQGKPESQHQLASIYRDGTHGVMQDYYMATKWFLILERSRTPSVRTGAQVAIAGMYESGGADANAVSEDSGGGEGGRTTGGGGGGRGGEPDFKKAFEWYMRAATCPLSESRFQDEFRGHAGAQFKVGEYLWKGIGSIDRDKSIVTTTTAKTTTSPKSNRNIPKALEWFLKAANQGHAQAQWNTGMIYLQGEDNVPGVKKDLQKAVEWFLKAAEQGYMEAQWQLGKLYLAGGASVRVERVKGLEWCRKAAVQGHEEARRALMGQGIPVCGTITTEGRYVFHPVGGF